MSLLYAVSFYERGRLMTQTEMRDHDQPKKYAQHYLADHERNGVPAAVLLVRFMQTGMHLDLQTIETLFNETGKNDPVTKTLVFAEMEKFNAAYPMKKAVKKNVRGLWIGIFSMEGLVFGQDSSTEYLTKDLKDARRFSNDVGKPCVVVIYDPTSETTKSYWNKIGKDADVAEHVIQWLGRELGSYKAMVDWLMKFEGPRRHIGKTGKRKALPPSRPKKVGKKKLKTVKSLPIGKDLTFTGPVIELGTGKNKQLVPMIEVQKLASDLDKASRGGRRRKKPSPYAKAPTTQAALERVKARKVITPCRKNFPLGLITIDELAKAIASPKDVERALQRFQRCDWGDVTATVVRTNNAVTIKRSGLLRGRYSSQHGIFEIFSNLTPHRNTKTEITAP